MTKKDKKQYQYLTDEDLKIIKSDPSGLTDYVIRTKLKETKKNFTILAILAAILAFAVGVFAGLSIARFSIPNNVVQIQVGDTAEPAPAPAVENAEEGK